MTVMRKILPLAILVSLGVDAATDNPWYAGARLGGTTYDGFSRPAFNGFYDDQDYGAGVFIGYKYIDWFGVEAGYTYLGEADYKPGAGGFEVYGLDLVGKFTYEVQPNFDLFAKAGGYWYNIDNSVAFINDDDDDISATIGAGLEYYFTNNLSVRAEYQYYDDVSTSKTGGSDIHFYGLSLVYGWGGAKQMAAAEPEPMVEEMEEKVEAIVEEPVPVAKPAEMMEKVMVEEVSAVLPFGFNSDALTAEDISALMPVGQQLAKYPDTKLYVVGHTDSRGTEEYNQTLSEERADSVVDYLMKQFSIERDRIIVEGRGELEPLASNDSEAGRAQNRRVEVFVPAFQMVQKSAMME